MPRELAMASIQSLTRRVLTRLQQVGPSDTPEADDTALALLKLRAAHSSLKKDRLVQWTEQDIPDYAEEPYVQIAAFLAGAEFEKPVDPSWYLWGRAEIESALQRYQTDTVRAEYF